MRKMDDGSGEDETCVCSKEMSALLKNTAIKQSDFSTLTKLDIFNSGISYLPISLPTTLPNLQILFLMKNKFCEVPAVIGSCKNLDMVSFKSNEVRSIHPDALQPQMRWLILTDNQITHLPPSIGRCYRLQKLMLSGNKIKLLPKEIENCSNLELVRLSSNKLEKPPMSLLNLPNLAWIALSDNPFLENVSNQIFQCQNLENLATIDIEDDVGDVLGKGASGITRKVELKSNSSKIKQYAAVKKYSSTITSDGNPHEERRANLAASSLESPCLVELLGQNKNGSLVMKLLVDFVALGNPPSLQTCSRDVYDEDLQVTPQEAKVIASKLLDVLKKLHGLGLTHGDFYSHNILFFTHDKRVVKLTDFGAASFYEKNTEYGNIVQQIEMRAFGHFLEEILILMSRSKTSEDFSIVKEQLDKATNICLHNKTNTRCFADLNEVFADKGLRKI